MELNAGKVLSVLNLVCQIWQVCCSVKFLVFPDIVSCTFIDSFFYIFFVCFFAIYISSVFCRKVRLFFTDTECYEAPRGAACSQRAQDVK